MISALIRQQQLHAEEITQLGEQHDQQLAKMKLELEGYIHVRERSVCERERVFSHIPVLVSSTSVSAVLQTQLQQCHLEKEAKVTTCACACVYVCMYVCVCVNMVLTNISCRGW